MTIPDPDLRPDYYENVVAKRALAWVIDVLLITVVSGVIALITIIGLWLFPLIYFCISFLYRVTTLRGGGTWGMRFFGVELVDVNGQHLTTGIAILHTLGYFVVTGMILPVVINWATILLTDKHQSLYDLVLGTVLLNRRR